MIKDWILKTFFSEELKEATRRGSIDAFSKAREDIMDGLVVDTEDRANELAKEKLAKLLSPVDMNKVVYYDKTKGLVYVGGERMDENKLANLRAEAEFFESSDLWHLMSHTPRELAQKSMFVSGESLADMQKGKSILYMLSSQQNILDLFKSYVKK